MNQQTTYRIREYTDEDFEACSEIFRSNVPKFFLENELADYQDFLRNYAKDGYWVVEEKYDGSINACGGIRVRESGDGGLCFGMVNSSFHRTGIGSALVRFRLAKIVSDPRVHCVLLDTSQYNPSFFERFGFSLTGSVENYYGPGLHRKDMRLDLPLESDSRQSMLKELLESLVNLELP